jgi:drug/metabolite transporter (DMT)-like permease
MRPNEPLKAIAWIIAAIVSFLVMAVSVRELSAGMHAFQMLFIRSVIGVAILAAVLSVRGWGQVRTRRLGGHLLRSLIHFAGQTLWIVGIALLPLATVAAIEFTTPIWGIFLAVLFLGERMNRGRWVSLAFGILGILIILRPGVEVISTAAVLMLGCTFCHGATNAMTKWLTRSDSPLVIVFYMVAIQTLIGALAAVFVWTPVAAGDWPFLALLGVTGVSAHYALTQALARADATFIMPFEFLRLPFVALIGFLVYAEGFEATVLIGAVLIFAGNTYSLRRESRLTR